MKPLNSNASTGPHTYQVRQPCSNRTRAARVHCGSIYCEDSPSRHPGPTYPESILRSCCSTVAVNVMSWNKAYSIFPLSTFGQYKGYNLVGRYRPAPRDNLSCSSLRGYSLRGQNLQELLRREEDHLNHTIRKYRRVGDGFTWTIPFNTKNVQWSKIPDQVLEYQYFQMVAPIVKAYRVNEPIACHIGAIEYINETLRYRYLCSIDLFRFLKSHIDYPILMEPLDTEPSTRPVVHASTMGDREGHPLRRFTDPEKAKARMSRDAEFPDWYREWERLSGDGHLSPEVTEEVIAEIGPPH